MDRKRRIEENEKLFREVNERVAQMHTGYDYGPEPGHQKTDVERVVRERDDYLVVENGA
jgi:hypothetical protein